MGQKLRVIKKPHQSKKGIFALAKMEEQKGKTKKGKPKEGHVGSPILILFGTVTYSL